MWTFKGVTTMRLALGVVCLVLLAMTGPAAFGQAVYGNIVVAVTFSEKPVINLPIPNRRFTAVEIFTPGVTAFPG